MPSVTGMAQSAPAFKINAKCVFSLARHVVSRCFTVQWTWQLQATPLLLYIWRLPGWDSFMGSPGPCSIPRPVLHCLGLGRRLGTTPGIPTIWLPSGQSGQGYSWGYWHSNILESWGPLGSRVSSFHQEPTVKRRRAGSVGHDIQGPPTLSIL